MRRYKIGRSLAWLLIAAGFLFFGIWVAIAVITMAFSTTSDGLLPSGFTALGQLIGGGFMGLVVALVGFLSLAFFDLVETYLQRAKSDQ